MTMKTYDPASVVVTFGVLQLQGFAEDSIVEAERNTDTFTIKKGVDGEGTRTRNVDRSGRVTVRLMQSSESNLALSALMEADEISANGVGILPLLVKDNSGNSLVFAARAWIVKPPKTSYGPAPEAREWIFEADELRIFEGGN